MKRISSIIIPIVAVTAFIVGKTILSDSNSVKLDQISQIYLNGNLDKSLSQLEKYLQDYPKDDLAWTIKGNILEDLDMDDKAEEAYRSALKLNKENFQATTGLGVFYRKQGDYQQAMSYYRKALELEPGYAQAYSSMAIIELKRNNDAEALRLAKIAYDNDKEDPVIAANLAVTYHYNDNEKERDKFTEIARKLGYKNINALQQIYSGELTIRD